MYYQDGNKKVKVQGFNFGGSSEGFSMGVSEGYNYEKKNMWMWLVLLALIIVATVLFIMWMVKKRKLKGGY